MNHDNFTADVIDLIKCGPASGRLACMKAAADRGRPLAQEIQAGFVQTIGPFVEKSPAIVRQIVARALLDYVDWDAVARAWSADAN